MDKKSLRTTLLAKREGLTLKERQEKEKQILAHLFSHEAFVNAIHIMTYVSFGSEIETSPLLELAYSRRKCIYVPRLQEGDIVAVAITSKEQLGKGRFGILEPLWGQATVPWGLELIIVPGLAFSKEGYRLGYGGGYFDRFLPKTEGVTIGLSFHSFLQDFPKDPWDVPVNHVITEEGEVGLGFASKP